MLTKLEIYYTAKSSFVADYNYQIEKAKKFQKRARRTIKRKEHWQKLADIFQEEAEKTSKKIIEIIDLILKEMKDEMEFDEHDDSPY